MAQIKICGITREEEVSWLNEAGVDYAGFVIFEKSKRNIGIPKAERLMAGFRPGIRKIAVTVSPDAPCLLALQEAGFDAVQIHGEMMACRPEGFVLPIWRAANISSSGEMEECLRECSGYAAQGGWNVEAFLIDAKEYGSGKTFGWETSGTAAAAWDAFRQRLNEMQIRFALAGGLNPSNVADGIRLFDPDIVDVSTGVEREDGHGKDLAKIRAFVTEVRSMADNRK